MRQRESVNLLATLKRSRLQTTGWGLGRWPVAVWLVIGTFDGLASTRAAPAPVELYHHQARHPIHRFDPIRVPRPAFGAKQVPLRTSFFLLLRTDDPDDRVKPDSVTVELIPEGGTAFTILSSQQVPAVGYRAHLFADRFRRYGGEGLGVYIEPGDAAPPLQPGTRYTVGIQAATTKGGTLPADANTWSFTTETATDPRPLTMRLDLAEPPHVEWEGEFFNAIAKPSFTTSSRSRIPHYELIAADQQQFPRAWTLQRDAYLGGFAHRPNPFKAFPNIVREKETRRIRAIERTENGVRLLVEDVFGHEQYGIPSGRPVSADYHPGYEVLIADGKNSARAVVMETDDAAATVQVTPFSDPATGWQLAYEGRLPAREYPHAPGLFPPGGTYLRRFDPVGTPVYYWGRVNHEWDILVKRYGRRAIPRFAGGIGCTALDGASGTTVKDYAQWHQVVRDITGYLIDRYGEVTLTWPWVILNEPDLMATYWRNRDWEALQKFYAYTADAILRAFEDRGYDSDDVRVGGLELGAIAGTNLRLHDFLIHCSPRATGNGALTLNKAYADARLDGQRSRRTERLCGAHAGRGVPLDFLSVHTYNDARMAAATLIRAKEIALEIDPDYYVNLPVVSHETVPTWQPIADPGAAEMYLGNGYFTSWATDFKSRLLQQAARDARYAYGGELVLMMWPGPARNFTTINGVVRSFRVGNRDELVPKPIHHLVNLLSTTGPSFWVLPQQEFGTRTVAGFASPTDADWRVVLYAHDIEDTQSRSIGTFAVNLVLEGVPGKEVQVTEYRFDRDHNSYYHLARELRDGWAPERFRSYTEEDFARIKEKATLTITHSAIVPVVAGEISWPVQLQANGVSFLVVKDARLD